jgi:asparaginyl-tRNA synthetase
VDHIIQYVFQNNISDLQYFLNDEDLAKRNQKISQNLEIMTFAEALGILYKDTNDSRYKEFSLKNFGSWEEIRLTEIVGKNVSVEKFPMLQIPFYHAIAKEEYNGIPLAQNADIILQGYREVIGSGVRIADKATLLKKAEIFNLPKEDYMPYLSSRDDRYYEPTA